MNWALRGAAPTPISPSHSPYLKCIGPCASPKGNTLYIRPFTHFFAYVSPIRNTHNVPLVLLQVLLRVILAGDIHPFWLVKSSFVMK